MSLNIWTQCGEKSNFVPFTNTVWRVVEAQHNISTRKLVESLEEQNILENLIERSKPPFEDFKELHYLLFTPFRYPPLRHGSRFGSHHERGIWYGSLEIPTALCETAYYRLIFMEGTAGNIPSLQLEFTLFSVKIKCQKLMDCTMPLFKKCQPQLISKTSYEGTQNFGEKIRSLGAEAILYFSARTLTPQKNIALFSPAVFAEKTPHASQTWLCFLTREQVEFYRKNVLHIKNEWHRFYKKDFEVENKLPQPAI